MFRQTTILSLALLLAAYAGSATATDAKPSSQLPLIECSKVHCEMVQPAVDVKAMLGQNRDAKAATPDTTPILMAPPAAQRLVWRGAGYPEACQDIAAITPTPTGANPYEYMKGVDIPIPLGTTHVTLFATASANLSGGPSGAAGDVGFLQIKRSSSTTWQQADNAYIYTIVGQASPQAVYGSRTYHSVISLADLPDGSLTQVGEIPETIDVRFVVFPLYTGGFSNVVYNRVCFGHMQLAF